MRPSVPLTPNSPLRRLHDGEEGMLSLVSLFVILAFLVLIALLGNVGMVTAQKIETQNAADSAAYSAAVEMARGMNAVTAINHLVGELTALVVLIHTLGGPPTDGTAPPPDTPSDLRDNLRNWYNAADLWSKDTDVPLVPNVYDEVSNDSRVDGAIFKARMRLKLVLTWAYQLHWSGALIQQFKDIPIVGPILEGIGGILEGIAAAFEAKILQEWETLALLEGMARGLEPLKISLKTAIIPALHGYSTLLVGTAPANARTAVQKIGPPNRADCSVYPIWPQLPLVQEPPQLKDFRKSQLVRAATPWIQWWRQPWMEFGRDVLRLSRFACAFQECSRDYTQPITDELKQRGVRLYILDKLDLDGAGKTNEPWTLAEQSDLADRLFTVVGFAHRSPPPVFAGRLFPGSNPHDLVCYAQAMVYNANRQVAGSGDGATQPTAGWDTLNWSNAVPEFPGPDCNDDCTIADSPQPRIRLNWQAKLVPTTRLKEAIPSQGGAIGSVLQRMLPDGNLARTH